MNKTLEFFKNTMTNIGIIGQELLSKISRFCFLFVIISGVFSCKSLEHRHEYSPTSVNVLSICEKSFILDQVDLSHLTTLVKQPLESGGCFGFEKDTHPSDNEVREMLFEMLQGVHSLEAIANLPRKGRCKIVILALQRGAGIRQLERITGIGFSTIRRLKMKNVSKTPSP